MIKDEKLRDELFGKFPKLSSEEVQNIQNEYMEHYVLYNRIRKGVYKCSCTRCGKEYTIGENTLSRVMEVSPEFPLKHKSEGICPECKLPVTYLAAGKGRKYIYENKLFAVFHVVEGNLYISCFDVYKKFIGEDLVFSWIENNRYCLTPDGAQHWKDDYELHNNHWMKWWKPLKSENGSTDYIMVNEDVVSETFLKYAEEIADNDAFSHYITYLCMMSNHPNLEYLIKTGFGYIITTKLYTGGACGLRINYRSSNVKKMLGLNKTEMDLLQNKNCTTLKAYISLRKADKNTSEKERAEIAATYASVYERIVKIMEITGLSLRKTMNYIKNQNEQMNTFSDWGVIHDWADYLHECQKLDYDLTDSLINRPKDLQKAHERTTKLIKYKADEIMRRQLEKCNKLLKKFEYTDEKRGLQIIVPKDMEEIIEEGRRLDHCVGGYAQRHAQGKLTILFLRTADKPDVPYYTMEVDTNGRIVQCRGFKNNCAGNPKPQEIRDFENEYQSYLNMIFKRKRRKTA